MYDKTSSLKRFRLGKAFLLIIFILTFGTMGYNFLENWPLLDSLYMTIITLTTIGFGEVHPLDQAGKIFTIVLILFGVGTVGYTVLTGTAFIIEGEMNKLFKRRRFMKAIKKIKDHYIVCGFGRMGSFVCLQLERYKIPFVVVEKDPKAQEKIIEGGYLLVPGDATEGEILKEAGIESAKGLVSVLQSDADNVYTVLSARELRPDMEIIARAGEDSAHKKLSRAGANKVISPYHIGGMRMVMSILKPTVMNFLEVVMEKDMNIEIAEVNIRGGSPYNGKRLADTDIRKEQNLIVVGIKKKSGEMVFNPGSNTVIEDHDTLIAMGNKDNLTAFEQKANHGG